MIGMRHALPTTFDESLHNFEALEQALDLPSWTVQGVRVWKLLRFQLFSEYRQAHGLMDDAHPEVRRLRKSKLQLIRQSANPFLTRNPFLCASEGVRRVIIPHPRKENIDGRMVDPISYPAWAGRNESTSIVLDRTSPLVPHALRGAPSYDVLLRLAWIRRQTVRVKLADADYRRISGVESACKPERGNPLSGLEKRVVRAAKSFRALEETFSLFLKRTRPSYLYLVVSYGNEAPIAAAKKLGIHVVEFQHGSLGRGHLGYDFQGWPDVPYFPDHMLAFGGDWYDRVELPADCVVSSVGAPQIEASVKEATRTMVRNNRQLLVLSQGPHARELLVHVAEFCRRRPDWRVLVRPHPSERDTDLCELLIAQLGPAANQVAVGREVPLVRQAADSSVVLGINSTAIVEALLAGCQVALMDLKQGASYFEKLVTDGHATPVRTGQELAEIIDHLPCGTARGYFSAPKPDILSCVEGGTG